MGISIQNQVTQGQWLNLNQFFFFYTVRLLPHCMFHGCHKHFNLAHE